LTNYYNTKLSNGKWKNMMSMHPRDLPVFDAVKKNTFSKESSKLSSDKIVIQGNQFASKKEAEEYKWKTINGLGYSNNAVTLFPLKQQDFKTEKPFVLYEFKIENAGEYEIEVHLLPTHSNNFDQEIGVHLDEKTIQFFKINTKDRDKTWKENVLRNSAIVKVSASNLQKGRHTIRIEVNQTGIVLDYITVKAN
jgi:hypothetical protein